MKKLGLQLVLTGCATCVVQSKLHVEDSELLLPKHPLPAALRLCGKLSVLDSLLVRLLAGKHKVCSRMARIT